MLSLVAWTLVPSDAVRAHAEHGTVGKVRGSPASRRSFASVIWDRIVLHFAERRANQKWNLFRNKSDYCMDIIIVYVSCSDSFVRKYGRQIMPKRDRLDDALNVAFELGVSPLTALKQMGNRFVASAEPLLQLSTSRMEASRSNWALA